MKFITRNEVAGTEFKKNKISFKSECIKNLLKTFSLFAEKDSLRIQNQMKWFFHVRFSFCIKTEHKLKYEIILKIMISYSESLPSSENNQIAKPER